MQLLLKCPMPLSSLWHVKSLHKLPFLMVKQFLLHLWQLATSTCSSLSVSFAAFRPCPLYPSTLLWKYIYTYWPPSLHQNRGSKRSCGILKYFEIKPSLFARSYGVLLMCARPQVSPSRLLRGGIFVHARFGMPFVNVKWIERERIENRRRIWRKWREIMQ